MKRKIGFGLFFLFLLGQLSLPVFVLAAEPMTGLKKVSEFKSEDLLNLLNNKIDLKSFLGKPVKIPLTFNGGEADSLYLIPPQFFIDQKTQKITVTPTRTIFLANGKNVSDEKIKYVRDELEKELNKIFNEKKDLLNQLRASILNQSFSNDQLQAKFKELKLEPGQGSWIEWLLPFVKAEETPGVDIEALQSMLSQTQQETGSATENLSQEDALANIVSSDDTKSRELLSLLLLLLIYKNAIAEADNTDKTDCVGNGGEWVNEQCVYPEEEVASADEKKICTEGGGEWKTDFSQRKICMAFCDATDDDCTDKIVKDEIGRSGCICPADQCVTAAGDCTAKTESAKDKDEDEIPDSADKCPNTKDQGDGVNLDETSADYGCSCADLQAKGRIQQRQCPGGGCDGAYLVQYNQTSGTDSCQNGVVSQFSCVANRYPSQQCQPQNNNNQNQNGNKNDNNSWQDMLKDLMGNKNNGNGGGQQGGGQQGGGDQSGGDQKSGCSTCSQEKTEQQKQQTAEQIRNLPDLGGQKAAKNVQDVINKNYDSGEGIIKDPEQASNFSDFMEKYTQADSKATPEQVREAANRWVSDNLAPGDKVSPSERAEMYRQIEQATTGASSTTSAEGSTVNRTYSDGSKEGFTYHPDGSVTKTSTDANGATTTKTYDKDGKEIPGKTSQSDEPKGWDTAATSGGDPILAQNQKNIDQLGNPNASADSSKANFEGPTMEKQPVTNPDDSFWGNMDAQMEAEAYGKVQDAYDSGFITDTQAIDIQNKFESGELSSGQIQQAINQANSSLPSNPANDPNWGSFNDVNFTTQDLADITKAYENMGFSPEEIGEILNELMNFKPENEKGDGTEATPEEQEQIDKDQETLDSGGSIDT